MESNDPVLITKLRDSLVEEMTVHPESFEDCDLESVKTNDWTIQRFMAASKMDLVEASILARNAMKWRKSFGVNTRTQLDFPIEFYKVGAMFPYSEDKEGRPVIYIRIKLYKNLFPKFAEHIRHFLIDIINRTDIKTNEKGFAMVWDLTGAGPSNWDLIMIRFIITSLRTYFPGGLKYLIPYGVPWIMIPFVNIVLQILPEESRNKIKFKSRDQIFEYIEPNNVPDFMTGLSVASYKVVADGAKSLSEMGNDLGFSQQDVKTFMKFYEHELL